MTQWLTGFAGGVIVVLASQAVAVAAWYAWEVRKANERAASLAATAERLRITTREGRSA